MSKVLARAMAKLGLSTRHPYPTFIEPEKVPMQDVRSLIDCEGTSILRLDYESSITDLSIEERETADKRLRYLKKEWASLYHLVQWEWDLDKDEDAKDYKEEPLAIDHPLLKRIWELSEYKWPLIWLLVYKKNKKVALYYDLEEFVDYTEEQWEKFKEESLV